MNRRELIKVAALLMGGSLSGSLSRNVLAGMVPTDKPSRDIFVGDTRKMTAALADLIIPTTDTPGAIAAGVPKFIEMMVADWYTDTERKIFFDGLAALDAYCKSNFKSSFIACSTEQQTLALQDAEKQAQSYHTDLNPFNFKNIDEHTPFFTKIKDLTVLGYYTSEVGAKQELAYNPMPMRYEGDYDFSKVGKQWSW